jgi:hypothetical protein
MAINIPVVSSVVTRILGYRMTIAEWIGAALLAGAPYLAIGVGYAVLHAGQLAHGDGPQKVVGFLASIVLWPLLLVVSVCL